MIQYECNKGNIKLSAEGDVRELGADIATLIHTVHLELASKDLFQGLLLEQLLRANMEVVFNPHEGDADILGKMTGGVIDEE